MASRNNLAVFPQILETNFNDWKVFFNSDYKSGLCVDNKLKNEIQFELQKYTSVLKTDFRAELNFETIPYLVAFFPSSKEIRFFSPRLANEKLITESYASSVNIEEIENIKKHIEKIQGMDLSKFPTESEVISKKENLVDLNSLKDVNDKAELIVRDLLVFVNEYTPSLFEKISDFALGLTAQYALLRIHLLKFLAILPSLDHDKKGVEVKRILLEALRRFIVDNNKARAQNKKGQERSLPLFLSLAIWMGHELSKITPAKILADIVRFKVRFMAKRFIAGETIELADESLKSLYQTGRDVTLDQLGELVVSESEADHYMNEVLKLIRGFSLHVKKGEKNASGILRAHVSIKVSALCSDFKPQAFDYTYNLVGPRLKKILLTAKEHQVFINIDAEHYHYRDLVFEIYKKVLIDTKELHDYADTGIVLQAYLRDGYAHFLDILELAKHRQHPMPVRIVKGAYWDAETVEGDAHGFNAPQFLNKEETDIHFRQLVFEILKNYEHIKLCLASHNFSDHAFCESLRELKFPSASVIEHQCLHMTYEALSTALAKKKWVVRNYVPVGSLLVGMAYLVRRIMENSSQVGVLTIMRSHKKQTSLVSPVKLLEDKHGCNDLLRDLSQRSLSKEFFNVGPVRLYKKDHLEKMQSALSDMTKKLGKNYQLDHLKDTNTVKIISSSAPEIMVGSIPFATVEEAKLTLATLDHEYNDGAWSNAHYLLRAQALLRASEIMLQERLNLAALIVYEAGKTVTEALGDVDEAIDFLTFYARSEIEFNQLEKNLSSRGVVAVIAPWNFPLAIPCGMCAGALVAGNTVVLKSAEQTPLIAEELTQIFYRAGVPKTAFIHLPGLGETVGDFLVKDDRVSTIIFTGSKAVGTYIHQEVQKRVYQNKKTLKNYPVKAITEMGGKNAIIVTQNAELDETVSGILQSAFGHAGQKCSACSRVIVHESLKQKLIDRLKAACLDLNVGSALDFSTTINPLISSDDLKRVRMMVQKSEEEIKKFGGNIILNRSNENFAGFCAGPSLIEIPNSRARLSESVSQQEIFGPVIHITSFYELDEAIEIFNATDYALTGGVFSQSQDDLDYLMSKLHCGNLYINRTITGARVGIEPFGGFKLSGTGPKAGGKHYVLSLHQTAYNVLEDNLESNIESGSQFEVVLSFTKNLIQFESTKIHQTLDQLIQNLYGHENDIKDLLSPYKKWMMNSYENFLFAEHSNRKIPGQISVNSHSVTTDQVVCLSVTNKPHLKTLLQVLTAVFVGSNVSVLARNQKSYEFWKVVQSHVFNFGVRAKQFEVYFADSTNVEKTLTHDLLNHVIYDGKLSNIQNDLVSILHKNKNRRRLVHIFTVQDYFNFESVEQLFIKFINVRSKAINTMRHGAPLDLDL